MKTNDEPNKIKPKKPLINSKKLTLIISERQKGEYMLNFQCYEKSNPKNIMYSDCRALAISGWFERYAMEKIKSTTRIKIINK